jgi:hypothetical protein
MKLDRNWGSFSWLRIELAIGVAKGGGVVAKFFIIIKGKEEAQRIFTKTVVSRLKA